MERTYVMIKPDGVLRGLAGEIISRIEKKGYTVKNIRIMSLDKETVKEHYSHVSHLPFYKSLEEYMLSGEVWGLVVEGENVINGMRILMGATKFEDALPGTIRGDYAISTTKNIIHASDSPENAEIEIKRFF